MLTPDLGFRNGAGVGGCRVRCGRRGGDGAATDIARPGSAADGSSIGDSQPPETVLVVGPFLPIPPHGHLLEVRDPTRLQVGPDVHPRRAPPPPKVHHQVAAQRPPYLCRPPLLLAPILGDAFGGSGGAVESKDREVEERGMIGDG